MVMIYGWFNNLVHAHVNLIQHMHDTMKRVSLLLGWVVTMK